MVMFVLIFIIVVMMFVLVIIVIMVMAMTVLILIVVIIMVMMLVLVILFIMVMAMTVLVLIVVMVMMVMMLGGGALYLVHQLVHQGHVLLQHLQKAGGVQLAHRGGDDVCMGIERTNQLHGGGHLLGADHVPFADHDGVGLLDLVHVKLTEIAHVHLAFAGVHHGGDDVDREGVAKALDGAHNVAELAHARRLDDDAIGMETVDNLLQ